MDHVTAEGLACFARCPRAYYELHVDGAPPPAPIPPDAAGAAADAALVAAMLRLLAPERPGPAPPQSTVHRRLSRDLAHARVPTALRDATLVAFATFCREHQPFRPALFVERGRMRTLAPMDGAAHIAHRVPALVRDRAGWRIERTATAHDSSAIGWLEATLDAWAADDALDAGTDDDDRIAHLRRDLRHGTTDRREATRAEWRAARGAVEALLRDLRRRRGRSAFETRPSSHCAACSVRTNCPDGRGMAVSEPAAQAPRI